MVVVLVRFYVYLSSLSCLGIKVLPFKFLWEFVGEIAVSRDDKIISPTPSDSHTLTLPPELINPELKETTLSGSADFKSAEIVQLDTFKKLL